MTVATVRDSARRFLQRPGSVDLRRYQPAVSLANAAEERFRSARDDELAELTRAALDGVMPGRRINPRMGEFCAAARETVRRTLGERLYDEQLLGILGLLSGRVVEMATGEGKTLCGAVAAVGSAMQGRTVHVLSVNDYLARRDCAWMRPVFTSLGVAVDWIEQSHSTERRREAYVSPVVYGPVSEIGYDVLRDRLVTDVADRVAPELDVAIIDEVDSVLVDEARVPLVLAGAVPADTFDPAIVDAVRTLPEDCYQVDAEQRTVSLTDQGTTLVEKALGGIDLYAAEDTGMLAAVNVALYALVLVRRDQDYIVRDGAVQLVNPSRGRVALLQRWPDGLQAAVEAKEGVPPSPAGEILDSITVGNLVRRYRMASGMTGTAMAVAEELREFHQLEVAVVPRHRLCIRVKALDRFFATDAERRAAVVERIREVHATGRPILVGTLNVAASEDLAAALREHGLTPAVLNARNDAEEAATIARAGEIGRITVSTQMAGRGTDIRLGRAESPDDGSPEQVARLGGLCVIGYGRHDSSRLDDQLRGRAGRQGDPGSSEFFVSLEDDVVARHGIDVPAAADDPRVPAAVEQAQRIAQADNLQIHRTTWNYHHLVDQQRDRVLAHREQILNTDLASTDLANRCSEQHERLRAARGAEAVDQAARQIWLYHLDRRWSDHLAFLAELREGIHLRGLASGIAVMSPLVEFHREAMRAIGMFAENVEKDTAVTFDGLEPRNGELGLDVAIKRPTSTWTYMATDTPYGSEAERALRGLAKRISSKRKQGSRVGVDSLSPTARIVVGSIVIAIIAFILYVMNFGH